MRPSENRSTARRLAASYAAAAHRLAAEAGPAGISLKALRGLTVDVIALRRGDRGAARLKLEQERLRLQRGRRERRTGAGLRTGLGLRWSARRSSARASACHRIRGRRLRLRARSRASLQERLRRLVLARRAGRMMPKSSRIKPNQGLPTAFQQDSGKPSRPWRMDHECRVSTGRNLLPLGFGGRWAVLLSRRALWPSPQSQAGEKSAGRLLRFGEKTAEISTRPKFLNSFP